MYTNRKMFGYDIHQIIDFPLRGEEDLGGAERTLLFTFYDSVLIMNMNLKSKCF